MSCLFSKCYVDFLSKAGKSKMPYIWLANRNINNWALMFVVLYTIICCFSFRTSSLMTQKNYSPLHHCHIYIYSKLCLTYEVIDSVLKPQKVICIYLTVLGVYTVIQKKLTITFRHVVYTTVITRTNHGHSNQDRRSQELDSLLGSRLSAYLVPTTRFWLFSPLMYQTSSTLTSS